MWIYLRGIIICFYWCTDNTNKDWWLADCVSVDSKSSLYIYIKFATYHKLSHVQIFSITFDVFLSSTINYNKLLIFQDDEIQ